MPCCRATGRRCGRPAGSRRRSSKLRCHRRTGAGPYRRAVRTVRSCPSPRSAGPMTRSSWAEAISTPSSMMGRRSTLAARSPIRSLCRSIHIRAAPSADAALKEAGVLSEEEASPFAALAALKAKLGGGGPKSYVRFWRVRAPIRRERRRPGRCRTPPAAAATGAWIRRRHRRRCRIRRHNRPPPKLPPEPPSPRAVEQHQFATEALQHDFGGVAVVARLVLPFAGLDLAFDIDLEPLRK